MSTHRRQRSGLGRLELLLVIVVPCLVIGIAIPSVQTVRHSAAETQTVNNLRQVSLMAHSSCDVNKRLPPAYDAMGLITRPVAVHVHFLPFIEQDPLYRSIAETSDIPDNIVLPPYLAPLDPSASGAFNVQNFAANLRVFANKGVDSKYNEPLPELSYIEPGDAGIPRTFKDGTSNTILFATKFARCGDGGSHFDATVDSPFAAFFGQNPATTTATRADAASTFQLSPDAKECRTTPLMAQSFQPIGVLVGLGDGSVRKIGPSMSPETWNRAMQPNDSNALGSDW